MEPMDFQLAAAERILDLFRNQKQNRVLLADEVGLGKTIIASEVVKNLAREYRNAGKSFKVVYVCSNLNIAGQNCRKLGIPQEDCLDFSESRLSMQHLRLREQRERAQQLIPMTPATSFSMKGGQGIQEERALIYAVLTKHPVYCHYKSSLNRLLKFDPRLQNWESVTKGMQGRVAQVSAKDPGYLSEICQEFDRFLSQERDLSKEGDLSEKLDFLCHRRHPEEEEYKLRVQVINELRRIFARISLKSLHPDLVIMDEFQRFRELLEVDAREETEQGMLSRQFLNETDTKILLLSATPYKPFSTLEELALGGDDHATEFRRVMDFLYQEPSGREEFEAVWKRYSSHLADLRGDDLETLIEVKQDAEDAMYHVVCRTERRNESIFDAKKAREVPELSVGDVKSFIDMQHLMDALELGKFPVEYVKSAPYLMSFMKYKVWEKIVTEVQAQRGIPELDEDTLFLNYRQIDRYQPIPCNNARLEALYQEVFGKGRNGAECLLWIPASKPYYNAERTKAGRIYAQNAGYSKTLVFSSWEMVPRVIAGLTSYEAERLVYKKLPAGKTRRYFAEDREDMGRTRRRGAHQRIKDRLGNLEIYTTASRALAELYDPIAYMGQPINRIRQDIRRKVCGLLAGVRAEGFTKVVPKSADNIVLLLRQLDGVEESGGEPFTGKKFTGIPKGVEDLLTDMAIGAPANCAFRLFHDQEREASDYASEIAHAFVTLFNKPEAAGVLQTLYGDSGVYYEKVFRYCVEGNLQAVLDEYAFILAETGAGLVRAIASGFANTASIQVDTRETVKGQSNRGIRLRTHFAVGYYNAKISEKAVQRTENIRQAFNSPFRPFVLATTSIGQEGLDFHYYARKILHWNLPSNPIDIEQREGRINRYLCHAVRQNLAESIYGQSGFESGRPVWDTIMENAAALKQGNSDLVPFWCLPDDFPFTRKIERIVPMYPFSSDRAKYERLIEILSIYRLTLGQPRQEELVDSLRNEKLKAEDLERLYMDLSPWRRGQEKLTAECESVKI